MENFTRYKKYVKWINSQKNFQPESLKLLKTLELEFSHFPYKYPPKFSAIRLICALISFIDDYSIEFPQEFFDYNSIYNFLNWLELQKENVSLTDFFLCPAVREKSNALDAVMVIHGGIRFLARARDTRAIGKSYSKLSKRIKISQKILPFSEEISKGGDTLGDIYHYFANLVIGFSFGNTWKNGKLPILLFWCGPYLMKYIREGLFQRELFFGNHATVDHLGLRHGISLAKQNIFS